MRTECELKLSEGTNWIEIHATDTAGIMSNTTRFRIIVQGIPSQKTVFLVALGVSAYSDSSLNLRYAAKDATDFASEMEKLYGNNIRVMTLTNSEVTRNSLNQVREFLTQGPKTGDSIILYCAGHGVLDDHWQYVFGSHELDPEHPSSTGILMNELKECLTLSKARKRLLLMDTCHSGMIGEKDEIKLTQLGAELPTGISLNRARGVKIKPVPQLNADRKKRYIEEMFNLSSKSEGMLILGASGGGEFAQESGEFKNGIFTKCLIEGLRGQADDNRDGYVKVGELKNFISRRVPAITKGEQKPSLVCYDNDQEFSVAQCVTHKQQKLTWDMDEDSEGVNPVKYVMARSGFNGQLESLNILKDMFSNVIDYQYITGRLATCEEVIDDIKDGWNKWPHRSYAVVTAARKGNIVEVVYSYTLSNYETKTKATGYTKEIWTLDDQEKIVAWREIISKTPPDLSAEVLSTPADSRCSYSPLDYIQSRQYGYVNILSALFADYVDYAYIENRKASKEEVLKDIIKGFQKWVKRSYNLLAVGKKGNIVEVIYSFELTKPDASNRNQVFIEPICGYTKETWTLNEQGRIVRWREAVSKKTIPSLSPEFYVVF